MTFITCPVVMLPTNKKAILCLSNHNNLQFLKDNSSLNTNNHFKGVYQHLYITSDDEIKEGDWYINNNVLFRADDKFDEGNNPNQNAKNKLVISTTDNSLFIPHAGDFGNHIIKLLPQPSQSFIEKYVEEYNKGNVITDVLVEYEEKLDDKSIYQAMNFGMNINDMTTDIKLKVSPKDNTITIKKVKDSWNREELIELLQNCWSESAINLAQQINNEEYITFDQWVEKNL